MEEVPVLAFYMQLFLPVNASKCEVYAGQRDPPANREAVVPECVGGGVHEEEASMSQLHLHRLHPLLGRFPASVFVSEDEITRCPEGDGSDGTEGVQVPFIVSMLPHVIQPVLVPGREEKCLTLSAGRRFPN